MYPTGHAAVAVLPVVVAVVALRRRLPGPGLVGLAFFGSQFPDLVDKPLAHVFYVIPSGRVFLHSLPFAVPVTLVVGWYGWRTNRLGAGAVFVFAYLSHLVADNRRALLGPEPWVPPELLWPFVTVTPGPRTPHWAGIGSTTLHVWAVFSVLVLAVASYLVTRDLQAHVGALGPERSEP